MGWRRDVFEHNTKAGAVFTAPWLVKSCSAVLSGLKLLSILGEACCYVADVGVIVLTLFGDGRRVGRGSGGWGGVAHSLENRGDQRS
jgi:hypothetical protein